MTKSLKKKRALRIRSRLKKFNTDRYRLSIYKSAKNISAQIIDDKKSITLVSASSLKEKTSGVKKSDISTRIAEILAKKAIEKKITNVYFDRGRYRYHGRIKVFAETLRKNGLVF